METDIKEKRCNRCQDNKPLGEFYRNKAQKTDGHSAGCKLCLRQYQTQWREDNPDKAKEHLKAWGKSSKEWLSKNPEYMKEYYNKNSDRVKENVYQWRRDNPERFKEYSKEYMKKRRNGAAAGVYGLFFDGVLKYIGSSIQLEERAKQHLSGFAKSKHFNIALQEEFDRSKLSREDVTFRVLVEFNKDKYESEESLIDVLRKEEEQQIKEHLESGIDLYNVRNTHGKDRLWK